MKAFLSLVALAQLALVTSLAAEPAQLRLSVKEYRDKMKAGWVGQMAGVALGGPTEFKWKDKIIPAADMPDWKPSLINDSFTQDDIYVEMTFLRTLEKYGLKASIRQAGIDFANSGYPLWCANVAGRNNLRAGIAPPDSGHPKFNKCPNDIDYQIEADYSGLIAPGLPQAAVDLGEKFGRLMNYGDGVYAGQFMGALYAAAFFESDPVKLVETALEAIPAGSQYAEMVRDQVRWFRENPNDWEKTWQLNQAKYRENPEYQKASNGGIDCKINGAYVVMGLLYGKRDLHQTMVVSCRAGQDSDCNPSSSAGVLFTTIGFSKLPKHYTSELNESTVFSHTEYNFPRLLDVCEKLARQVVKKYGGRMEKDASGEEYFIIPVKAVKPSPLELSWAPGPIANSRFTARERAKITADNNPGNLSADLEKFAPGWKAVNCGQDMEPGLHATLRGRSNVLVVHPLDKDTGCTISRTVKLPAKKGQALRLVAGHHPDGDYDLIVRVNGTEVLRQPVGKATAREGWLTRDVDLSSYAGKRAKIEVINQASGWSWEGAYLAELKLVEK